MVGSSRIYANIKQLVYWIYKSASAPIIVRISMFIVLLSGIYCFPTSMTIVKTKVMALSAWPRT